MTEAIGSMNWAPMVLVACVAAGCASAPPAPKAAANAASAPAPDPSPHYGSNPTAGKTFIHDGVSLYYEIYGSGEPLLLIHGNGGSIASMSAQIDEFKNRFMVIAMDSRDHGMSGDSPGKLSYEIMADDLAALLQHLGVGPANVLGWSDGGVEALLLGIRHPRRVSKIAAMAANLNATDRAVYPECIAWMQSMVAAMPAELKESRLGRRALKAAELVLTEPHLDPSVLSTITAPALILSGDHDIIHEEHTIEIFRKIPNSQLCVFPGSTHMVPFDDPARFNATVERFFSRPFEKKDRILDLLKSLQALEGSEPAPGAARAAAPPRKPTAVDLRPALMSMQLVPRGQGPRGTCSVFTTCSAIEFALARLRGKPERLSVEFLNWSGGKFAGAPSDGNFFHNALGGFQRFGICAESEMPYRAAFDPSVAPSEDALASAKNVKSALFDRLSIRWIVPWHPNRFGVDDAQFAEIQSVLALGFPVAAGSGHSRLLVGYRDDPKIPGGGAFLTLDSALAQFSEVTYEFVKKDVADVFWIDVTP